MGLARGVTRERGGGGGERKREEGGRGQRKRRVSGRRQRHRKKKWRGEGGGRDAREVTRERGVRGRGAKRGDLYNAKTFIMTFQNSYSIYIYIYI